MLPFASSTYSTITLQQNLTLHFHATARYDPQRFLPTATADANTGRIFEAAPDSHLNVGRVTQYGLQTSKKGDGDSSKEELKGGSEEKKVFGNGSGGGGGGKGGSVDDKEAFLAGL